MSEEEEKFSFLELGRELSILAALACLFWFIAEGISLVTGLGFPGSLLITTIIGYIAAMWLVTRAHASVSGAAQMSFIFITIPMVVIVGGIIAFIWGFSAFAYSVSVLLFLQAAINGVDAAVDLIKHGKGI